MATTIQVKEATVERLQHHKEFSKESYDEVINKVLDELEEGELSEHAIKAIQLGLTEISQGKGERIEDVAAELGIKL